MSRDASHPSALQNQGRQERYTYCIFKAAVPSKGAPWPLWPLWPPAGAAARHEAAKAQVVSRQMERQLGRWKGRREAEEATAVTALQVRAGAAQHHTLPAYL